MSKLKHLCLVITMSLLAVVVIPCQGGAKEKEGNTNPAAVKILSLEELCRLYLDNPFTPDELYKNKKVEISDKVQGISKGLDYGSLGFDSTISFKTKGFPTVDVECKPTRFTYKSILEQAREGDIITIQGDFWQVMAFEAEEKMGIMSPFCSIRLTGCSFQLENTSNKPIP